MAETPTPDPNQEKPKREPISPVVRKRLQACFQQGAKVSNSGNYDYATEMFSQCVVKDPGSKIYLDNFLGNLSKKYNNNKKGATGFAGMGGSGSKAYVKKCSMQKDWEGVIKNGVDVLKVNPWDVSTLLEMATACEHLECNDCELVYLRMALDANMKDPAVNKRAGLALERQGQYDQAIVCWRRVEEAKPNDEEARKMIGNLSVERTIKKGGFEDAKSSTDVRADKNVGGSGGGGNRSIGAASMGDEPRRATQEELLKKKIASDPADLGAYTQLAEYYRGQDKHRDAEAILSKALQASGGDANIRDKLHDLQIFLRKQDVELAKQRYTADKTEELQQVYKKLASELNKFELDIYRQRTERSPTVLSLWAELGLRLEKEQMQQEAIKAYQKARGDETKRGVVLFGLGRCFQGIKQYPLAMSHYKDAIAVIPKSDEDTYKDVLYHAGRLAMGLKDLETARTHLNELASLDFGYRDVAERLDKLNANGDTP